MLVLFIIQLLCAVRIKCQMEGKVVRGDRVKISHYPHSAFLYIKSRANKSYVCGSSIINQRILLTAAHCIEECVNNRCTRGSAFIGHANKYKGMRVPLKDFIIHEDYDHDLVMNDIGLVAVRGNLELGEFVQRVSIVKNPPYFNIAAIAGWGLIDEMQKIHTQYLHHARQKIWPLEECRKVINVLPNGTFCGGELQGHQYASVGDSGSALVAEDNVQLGLVSFKRLDITRSVVIYTDVPFFYEWIKLNSKKLHCRSS